MLSFRGLSSNEEGSLVEGGFSLHVGLLDYKPGAVFLKSFFSTKRVHRLKGVVFILGGCCLKNGVLT